MIEYRRRINNKNHKWHWCINCPYYPSSEEFETKYHKPTVDLCDRCLEFTKDKKCYKNN